MLNWFKLDHSWRRINQVERRSDSCDQTPLIMVQSSPTVTLHCMPALQKCSNTQQWELDYSAHKTPSLDKKAGHTGGFRYPCSDSDVRPCSHNDTETGSFYLPVLTLSRNIKKQPLILSAVLCTTRWTQWPPTPCCAAGRWDAGGWLGAACCQGVCCGWVGGRVLMWCYGKRRVHIVFQIWIFSVK